MLMLATSTELASVYMNFVYFDPPGIIIACLHNNTKSNQTHTNQNQHYYDVHDDEFVISRLNHYLIQCLRYDEQIAHPIFT